MFWQRSRSCCSSSSPSRFEWPSFNDFFVRPKEGFMHVLVKGFAFVALVSATAGLISASPKPAESKPSSFEKLVDEFFDNAYFNFKPTEATSVGFHQYDAQLEDYTKAGVDKNIATLRTYRAKIEAGKPKRGTIEESDRDLILHYIDGAL